MNRNVTAVILIILAIGIYLEFTGKVWDEAQAVNEVNQTYITAISNADKLLARRDQVLAEYNALSANDQDRLNKMLPTTVDNIRLIIDLNSVAVRRGITLHSMKAVSSGAEGTQINSSNQPPSGNPSFIMDQNATGLPNVALDTVSVSFITTASYQQFIQFLRDVESNLHILDISHLKVTAHDNGLNDYSVEMKTYWLRQQ